MRTHPDIDYDFSDYDALSREQKDYLASVVNEDKDQRLQQMGAYKCKPFPERGIRLNTLPAGSGVQEIIQQQRWQQFTRPRGGYAPQLVVDFYGSMHPATYCNRDTVIVRGVRVRISPQDICEYHGLTYKRHLARSYGLSGNDIFKIQYNPEVAASLRRSRFPHWDASQRYCLQKSDLHHELGFLTLFIKASLKPSTHNTTIDQQVAEVLYSIQHNLDIDAGQIIWLELLDAGVKLDGVLPFPCMITDLCLRAGLQADLERGPEDFFEKHFNIQIRAHKKLNAKRLESGEAWEREMAVQEMDSEGDEDDDDYEPPREPYHTPMPQYVFPEDTPPYMTSIVTQFTQHVNLGFDHIHHRLDAHGFPWVDPPYPAYPQVYPQHYQQAHQPPQHPQQAAGPSAQGGRPRRRVRDREDEASGSGQNQPRAQRANRRR